jgi:recombinational DNA repair protein RecT
LSDAGPPDWFDNAPPADSADYGSQPARGNGDTAMQPYAGGGRARRGAPPEMTPEQAAAAAADFMVWLTSRETRAELELVLPDHVDVDVFIATAKTAVLNKPSLLREDLRQSLLLAVQKAASQGLMPDGKQGALVPRYDTEARKYAVAWQPMVWGITKLGRETGAIRTIRAVIVFHGEPFRIVQGDEDRIEHEVCIDIVEEAHRSMNGGLDAHKNPLAKPDEFFARVRAAYCVITGVDGAVTKRWMTKEQLVSLRDASRAANGPWGGRWMSEMIIKGVILFTSKWINLDASSAPAKRFQAALMTDMEIDFDRERETAALPAPAPLAALPAPEQKLCTLEEMLGREQEKVLVGDGAGATTREPGATSISGAGGDGPPAPTTPSTAAPPAAGHHAVLPTSEPPPDPLAARVDTALLEISKRTAAAVAKMVAGTSYKGFVKELTDARRPDLIARLADAVEARASEPTEGETLARADVQGAATWQELGDLERNAAFKSRVAALPPAAHSRIAAAIAGRYASFAPSGDGE